MIFSLIFVSMFFGVYQLLLSSTSNYIIFQRLIFWCSFSSWIFWIAFQFSISFYVIYWILLKVAKDTFTIDVRNLSASFFCFSRWFIRKFSIGEIQQNFQEFFLLLEIIKFYLKLKKVQFLKMVKSNIRIFIYQ